MTPQRTPRRLARRVLAAGFAPAVLALSGIVVLANQPKSAVPRHPDDRTIIHVLNRLGYGPRSGDVDRIRSMGLDAYIDQQLHPERLPDAAMAGHLAHLTTVGLSTRQLVDEYFLPAQQERRARQELAGRAGTPPADSQAPRPPSEAEQRARQVPVELSEQKILRAVYSERQLQEVMTDFWFNHFNVFAGKGATQLYLSEYEREAIRPHALGKFRDLLEATAKSPAMLFYLDNWMSVDPNAAQQLEARRASRGGRTRFGPARPGGSVQAPGGRRSGLNENYARELMELHTLGVDGGYSQQDVVEVARCFTGWTIADPRQGGGFRFNERLHDPGRKLVLGREIKNGGEKDGEAVLDLLARHPSTATFIATKLARRFVSDDPPAALVARAARRFQETGGDIREVVRLIVTSPEFFAPEAYRAKVKSPLEFVASALRATSAGVEDARAVVMNLRVMGMPLYFAQPPTGYADRADAWVNTGSLVARMNFALAAVANRLPGVRVDLTGIADTAPDAASKLANLWLGGDVSDTTRKTLAEGGAPVQIAALTLGAPEFQRR